MNSLQHDVDRGFYLCSIVIFDGREFYGESCSNGIERRSYRCIKLVSQISNNTGLFVWYSRKCNLIERIQDGNHSIELNHESTFRLPELSISAG